MQNIWNKLPFIGRLLVTASTALMVAGGAMLFIGARQEAAEIQADLRIELEKELETLPAALVETVVVGDFATLQQTLDRYVTRPLIASVEFKDVSGTRLSSIVPPIPSSAPTWFLDLFDFSEISGSALVRVGGRSYGELSLTLTADRPSERAWKHLQNHLAILLLAIGLDFVGIWLVLRSGLRPLRQLEEGAEAIARGQLGVHLTPAGSPELVHVINSFNQMIRSVQELESELREHMSQMSAILDNSSVGIAYVRQRKIVWANERMCEIFGYTLDDIRDQDTRMFYPDAGAYAELGARAYPLLSSGQRFVAEQPMRHRQGHSLWVRIAGKAINVEDSGAGSIWIFDDIAQQKQTEAALIKAREEAEAANVAKSRFLATMSHEIRTPMNGILGMAQMLLFPEISQEERLDYARTILNSGQTLLTLLNDILDLSKVEAGKLELESTPYDPAQLLHEIQALFAESARGKQIDLSSDWSGPAHPRYLGDAYRLRQMLSNLVGNALKFTASGHIGIAAREIADNDSSPQLEFSVSDTGIGIPADKLPLLFQPFSQADSSITRQFSGTGLGLSIVRSLAHRMGGEVGVESEAGQGSRFWFRIPAQRMPADEEARRTPRMPVQHSQSHTFSGTVLVVEDNRNNRMVISALLGKLGLKVLSADDGQQALDLITQNTPVDLVLMDIQMPVMDGYRASELIREWENSGNRRHLPIIALTADAFDEDRQRALASGMDAFMTKPIELAAMKNHLAQWLPAGPASAAVNMPKTVNSLDPASIVPLIHEICDLLAQNKFNAVPRFKALQATLADTELAAPLADAGKALDELRFGTVQQHLQQILTARGWDRQQS